MLPGLLLRREDTTARLKSARQPVFSHILPDDHPSLQYCKVLPPLSLTALGGGGSLKEAPRKNAVPL